MSVEAATERVIRFHLNGEPVSAQIANHHTLVELLQRLGLTGARESCAQGLCGCCTVLVNGLAVSACLYLAAFVDDAEVITIEQAQGDDRQRMLATAQQAKSATLRSPSGRDATMAHRDLRPGTSRGASSLTPNPSPGGRGERCVPARRAGSWVGAGGEGGGATHDHGTQAAVDQPLLDAVQKAFAECGAFQCGFCTPGFVLMSRQLLDENPAPSEDEIRRFLSGNLCRCAAYPEIIRAVQLAARMRAGEA